MLRSKVLKVFLDWAKCPIYFTNQNMATVPYDIIFAFKLPERWGFADNCYSINSAPLA